MATEEGWGGRLLPSPLSPSPRVFPSPSAGDTAPRPAWAGSGIHAWAGVGRYLWNCQWLLRVWSPHLGFQGPL